MARLPALARAAAGVVHERDAAAVLERGDHLVPEYRAGRTPAELGDVRAAEAASEDVEF